MNDAVVAAVYKQRHNTYFVSSPIPSFLFSFKIDLTESAASSLYQTRSRAK